MACFVGKVIQAAGQGRAVPWKQQQVLHLQVAARASRRAWEHASAFLDCLWSAQIMLSTLSLSPVAGVNPRVSAELQAERTMPSSPTRHSTPHCFGVLTYWGRDNTPCSALPPLCSSLIQCIHPLHPCHSGRPLG